MSNIVEENKNNYIEYIAEPQEHNTKATVNDFF